MNWPLALAIVAVLFSAAAIVGDPTEDEIKEQITDNFNPKFEFVSDQLDQLKYEQRVIQLKIESLEAELESINDQQ